MKRIFSLILVCLLAVPSSMMAAQEAAPVQDAPISARAARHSWFTSLRRPTPQQVTSQALIIAADQGNEDILRVLLAAPGIDVNAQDIYGKTALMVAAEVGHEDIVRVLLAAPGIDVNLQGADGKTALIHAIENEHEDSVRMLLAASGIDVNVKSLGSTALMEAVYKGNENIVRMLLDTGADVNVRDRYGRTALMRAADKGNENIVRMLLDAGADVNVKNRGWTALDIARKGGHQNTAAMIRDVVSKKARSFMFAYEQSRETATSDPDPESQTRLGDLPPEIARLIAEQVLGKSSADRND